MVVFVVDEVVFLYGCCLFGVGDCVVDCVGVEMYVVDFGGVVGFVVDGVVFDDGDVVVVVLFYLGFEFCVCGCGDVLVLVYGCDYVVYEGVDFGVVLVVLG